MVSYPAFTAFQPLIHFQNFCIVHSRGPLTTAE
jgi:hypothetical protein